jgi:release factor glutamine methyltransferase
MIPLSAVQQKQKQWKLIDLLNWTADYLTQKGFENGRLETERLLAHSLDLDRIDLYVNFDRPLVPEELSHFKSLLKRRLEHEPLQYILGETEFYSLPFNVASGVLIPRPETEILVDQVRSVCSNEFQECETVNLLDVGTGSGNIAIACARHIPNAKTTAVDVSEQALEIAQQNAELNEVAEKVAFFQQDALGDWKTEYHQKFDVIVSNPPYISTAEYEKLDDEIKNFEPQKALLAGEKGLCFYHKFLPQLHNLLKPGGFVFFEIGETQAQQLSEFYSNNGFSAEIIKDLAEKDRILKIKGVEYE